MKKAKFDSFIEVWSADYINKPKERNKEDVEAIILQIEHAINDNYIVEVKR